MSSPPSSLLSNLVSARKAATKSSPRQTVKDESGSNPSDANQPAPWPSGDSTMDSARKSTGGGFKEGEIPVSLLSDSIITQTIPGSRNLDLKNPVSNDKPSTLGSPKGTSSIKYSFVLLTEEKYQTWCRGCIASSINDLACAKPAVSCNTASHVKKHEQVHSNHVYIISTSSNESNPTRKIFNPVKFGTKVNVTDYDQVQVVVNHFNEKLSIEGDPSEERATILFIDLISTLASIGTKTFKDDDEGSVVLVENEGYEVGDLEIKNMMTAKEEEHDLITDEKDGNVDVMATDTEVGITPVPQSYPNKKDTKLSINTFKDDEVEHVGSSPIEEENPPSSTRSKRTPRSLQNGKFSTSKEFMFRFKNSGDNGYSMMEALCQRILSLENYTRTKIRPKVLANGKKIKEVEEGFDVLFNPDHPTTRLSDMQLQLDGFEENLDEIYDKMESPSYWDGPKIKSTVYDSLKQQLPSLKAEFYNDVGKSKVIQTLQEELNLLKGREESQTKINANLQKDLSDLKALVNELSKSVESANSTSRISADSDQLRRSSYVDSSNDTVIPSQSTVLGDKIAAIKYQITLMESRMGQEFLQFGNNCLRSHADTCLFVNDHVKNNSFGCFFDLVALMNAPRDSQTDEKTFLDASYNAQRTKFLSMSEVSTSTSFLHVTPLVFCASNKQLHDSFVVHGSVDKLLPLVKNRESWSSKGGLFGMKRELERNIASKVSAIDIDIHSTLGTGPAADLAKEYLRASHGCFNDFVNWTENFFHKLQAMASVSEDEAWALILDCWMTFFIDLRKIRMECSSLSLAGLEADSDQRKEIVARYIWTMGKAIKLQEEFREKQFRNHPSISTVINFYLFSHKVSQTAHTKQMTKVHDELKGIQAWRSSTTRDLNKLLKKS
jgi:hypothetical protein